MTDGIMATGISSIAIIFIAVILFFFWISMLADCARRSFARPSEKVMWLFLIAVLQVMGAFFYWYLVQRKDGAA